VTKVKPIRDKKKLDAIRNVSKNKASGTGYPSV